MTLTASTTLVSRTRPSGIMPTKAATVLTIALGNGWLEIQICFANRASPMGMRAMPIHLIILLIESMISE